MYLLFLFSFEAARLTGFIKMFDSLTLRGIAL